MSEPMVEMVIEGETTEPSGTHSGEKRPAENGENCELDEPHLSKKARNCPQLGRNLKRVAEIVLVMSTMAAVRGGKKPSEAEVELMAEARAKLVEICEGLAPKDIVGREGIGSVIEDLGLNGKAKDQKLGFRGPRLSIVEKFTQAKRKMEESKKYNPPSAYGSHQSQTNFTPSVESRGALPAVRMFPSEKTNRVITSVGGSAVSLPPGHVSVTGSAFIQVQLPSNEVRAHVVSSGFPINHQGRDSSSFLHGPERQLNGTLGSQTQVSSSVNHPLMSAPTWSAQTQPALSAKGGPEQKPSNHSAVSVQGTTDSSTSRSTRQSTRDQSFRPSISQTLTGNMPGLQSPVQGTNLVQAPSLSNNHNEITKIIQKLLQPQLPDHPTWNPPSRDYMNKAVTCQICQITINEVDSILICDACEKGFHLKCIQSPDQRAIPRGEWHCSRCLTISHGKPLPPKYGRVMRSSPPPKVSMNTSGVQQSEKTSGTIDQKDNAGQLKLVSNGGSDVQSQPVDHGSNIDESSSTKIPDAGEIHGNHFVTISRDIDEKPTLSTALNTPVKSLGPASGSSSAELSSERSPQHIKSSGSPKGEDGSSEPPKDEDGSSEPPKGDDGSSEPPKGDDGSSEPPKDEDRSFESPKGEDGSCESPKGEDGSSESLLGAYGSSESPKGVDGSSESPKCGDRSSESPKGGDGSSESPKGGDGSSESTRGGDGSSESTRGEVGSFKSKAEPPNVSHIVADNFNGPEPPDNFQIVDLKMDYNCPQSSRNSHSTSNVKKDDHENLQKNIVEISEASVIDREQSGTSSNELRDVEWIGKAVQFVDTKGYYNSCRVDGVTYEVRDFALFPSSQGKLVPFRLQSMCHDFKTGLKWVILKRCYYPDEVPENVSRPRSPECNEVYFSERYSCVMAGLIRGPCELLPDAKFREENERRKQLGPATDNGIKQIFLCNWLYSEVNGNRQFLPYPSPS